MTVLIESLHLNNRPSLKLPTGPDAPRWKDSVYRQVEQFHGTADAGGGSSFQFKLTLGFRAYGFFGISEPPKHVVFGQYLSSF